MANDSGSSLDPIFRDFLPGKLQENKELVKIVKAVYQWNITKDGKTAAVWTVDVKNGDVGSVYQGPPKIGKADCTITIEEKSAIDIFEGRLDPTKAFMTRKFKLQGNLMAAQKLQQLMSDELRNNKTSLNAIIPPKTSAPAPAAASSGQSDNALIESIPNAGLKSDIIFDVMKSRMHEEPDLVSQMKFVLQFDITKEGKKAASWTVDTKSTPPTVYREDAKVKADATVIVDDETYVQLLFGKLNGPRAFMTGKVKVKGNILLLQKLDGFWTQVQGSRSDPEMPYFQSLMLKEPLKSGLRSETIIFELIQRLVRSPDINNEKVIYGINVLKNGQVAHNYALSFDPSEKAGLVSREKPSSPSCAIDVEDDDLVRLTYNTLKLNDAIQSGRVKVSGNNQLTGRLDKLFSKPSLRAKL